MLFLYVMTPVGHHEGGHLQRNTSVINAFQDVHI